jgi:hypothetical protein
VFLVMQFLYRWLHPSLSMLCIVVMVRGVVGFWPLTSSPVTTPDVQYSKRLVHEAAEAVVRKRALQPTTSTRRKLLTHDESFLQSGCMPYGEHSWYYVDKECKPPFDDEIAYYNAATTPPYEILEGENHAMACARLCAANTNCVFFQTFTDHPGSSVGQCTLYNSNYLPDNCELLSAYQNYDGYQKNNGEEDPDREGAYNFTRNAPCPTPTFAEFFSGYGDCVDSTEWTQMFGSLEAGIAGGWSNLAAWDGTTTCSDGTGVTESDYSLAASGTPQTCGADTYYSPATQEVCTTPPAFCDPLPVLANGSCGWGRCLQDGVCMRDRPGSFPYTSSYSVDGVCGAWPACDWTNYHVPVERDYNGMVYTGARVHMHGDVEGRTGIFTETGVQVTFAESLTRAQCMGECGSDPLCNFAAFEDWGADDKAVGNCFKAYCNGKLDQCFTPTSSGTYALFQDMDQSCTGVDTPAECKSCPPNAVSDIGTTSISDCLCAEGYVVEPNGDCTACPSGAMSVHMESTNPKLTFSMPLSDYASDVNTYYWKATGGQVAFLTSDLFPSFSTVEDWPSCIASDADPASMSGELFTNYPCVVKTGDHPTSPERQCDGNSVNIIQHQGTTKNYMNTCPAYLFRAYIQDKDTMSVSQHSFRVSIAGWLTSWWYLTTFHSVHQIYHFPEQVSAILVSGDKLFRSDPDTFQPVVYSAIDCFCPTGYSTDPITGVCTLCEVGTFSAETNASTCSPCPDATTTSTQGGTFCDVCRPGFYRMSNGTCAACLPGSYSDQNNATGCTACALGSYASNYSSSECDPCPRGTYANTTGSLVCKQCPAPNTTVSNGAQNIAACSVNTRPCGPGLYWMDDAPASRRLLDHNAVEESKCSEVEVNGVRHAYSSWYQNSAVWYKPNAAYQLIVFYSTDSSWILTGKSLIHSCAIKCVEDARCISFLVQEKHQSGATSDCRLYNHSSPDTSARTNEGAQYWGFGNSDSDESFFMVLDRNHDCSNTYSVPGSCYPCPVGTWSNLSDTLTCMSCPENTTSLHPASWSQSLCQPTCTPGHYISRNFSYNGTITHKLCAPCEPGTFSSESDSTVCTACADGTASGSGSPFCVSCLNHSTSNAENTLCQCNPGYTCNMNSDGITHLTLGTYELVRTNTTDTVKLFIDSQPQVFNDPARPSPPRTCTSQSNCYHKFWTFNSDWCNANKAADNCLAHAKTDRYVGYGMRVFKFGYNGVMRSLLPYDEVTRDNLIVTFRDQTFVLWRGDIHATGSNDALFVSTPERPLDAGRDFNAAKIITDYSVRDWLSLTEPLTLTTCENVYWMLNDYTNPGNDADGEQFYTWPGVNFATHIACQRWKPFFVWVKKPDNTIVKCHVKIMWVSWMNADLVSGHPDTTDFGFWILTTYKDPEVLRFMDGSSLRERNLRTTPSHAKWHTEEYDTTNPYDMISTFRVNGEPAFTPELLKGSKIYSSDPTPSCSTQQQVEGDCTPCPDGTGKLSFGASPCMPMCQKGELWNTGSESCAPCPDNTFQDTGGLSTECKPCPTGFTTSGSGGQSLDVCRPPVSGTACGVGYFNESDACFPCPVGTFAAFPDQQQCTPCPESTTTVLGASNSSSACIPYDCPPGNFLYLGMCTACPIGTYLSPTENKCVSCADAYTTSNPASTSIDDCILDTSSSGVGTEFTLFKSFRFRTTVKAYEAIKALFLKALVHASTLKRHKVSQTSFSAFTYADGVTEVQARFSFLTVKTQSELDALLSKVGIEKNLGALGDQLTRVKMLNKRLRRRVQLPYSLTEFQDETLRLKFRTGMARAAKVGVDDVVIVSVTSVGGNSIETTPANTMRRLLQTEESVNVDTNITTTEDNPVNTSLTDETLNEALATEGVQSGDLNPPDTTTTTAAPTTTSSTTTTPTPTTTTASSTTTTASSTTTTASSTTTTASSTTTPTTTTSSSTSTESATTSTTTPAAEMTTPAPGASTSTDGYGLTTYVHAERPCGKGYYWDSGDDTSSRRLLEHYSIEESQCNEVTVNDTPYSYTSYYQDSLTYYKPAFEYFLQQFSSSNGDWVIEGESMMTSCAIKCAQNVDCLSFLLEHLHGDTNYIYCNLFSSATPSMTQYANEYFRYTQDGIVDADQSFFMVMDRGNGCATTSGLSGSCNPCPVGTYSNLDDVTVCTSCPNGTTTPYSRTYTADFCFPVCNEGQYVSQNFSMTYDPKGPDCKTITVNNQTHDYEDMFNGTTTHRPANITNRIYTTEGTWPAWTEGRTADYAFQEDCAKICALYDRCVLFHVYMRTTGTDPVICDLYNSRDTVDSAA